VRENEGKYAGVRMPYPDIVNISMNQVMMRSILTSLSSMLPVLSLLLIGAGLLGAVTLSEFALALLVGVIAGVYSSIFIATPLLATLKANTGRVSRRERLLGEDLRGAVMGAGVTGRVGEGDDDDGEPERIGEAAAKEQQLVSSGVTQPADRLLTHPPRPRKKKRR
jgi:preprotein translocase subunit SecF